jgi:hypothetical protein
MPSISGRVPRVTESLDTLYVIRIITVMAKPKLSPSFTPKPKVILSPAESMLKAKELHIKRLRQNIVQIGKDADAAVAKVQARMRVAQTILDALKKGTLKP